MLAIILSIVLLSLASTRAAAQPSANNALPPPGTRDPSFTSPIPYNITALCSQPDGKMLFGYSTANGPYLARMDTAGSLDTAFVTNGIPFTYPGVIRQIAVRPDGKIYAAGVFRTTFPASLLVRLNSDGTLDPTFQPHFSLIGSPSAPPLTFGLLGDDKLIVSGSFFFPELTTLTGPPFRLFPNGVGDFDFRLDKAFSPAKPSILTTQPDGTVLMTGAYSNRNGLFRLNTDGLVDTNFVISMDILISNGIPRIAYYLQEPSTILVAGPTVVDRQIVTVLARVNSTTGAFLYPLPVTLNGAIGQMIEREDGKIYISGSFTSVSGRARNYLARLNSDGTLDEAYDPGSQFSLPPLIQLQTDNRLLAFAETLQGSGSLFRLADDPLPGILRLATNRFIAQESDGFAILEVDRLNGSTGPLSTTILTTNISALAGLNYVATNLTVSFTHGEFGRKSVKVPIAPNPAQTGHKTFLVYLDSSDSTAATVLLRDDQIERLEAKNAIHLDGPASVIRDFALFPNGSVLVGGRFDSIQGVPATNLARLRPDFTLDPSFAVAGPTPPEISRLAIRPDGRILFAGPFTEIGQSNWTIVAQLNSNLTYDADFNTAVHDTLAPFGPPLPPPTQLVVLADGSVLEADSARIRRINPDGSLDPTFNLLVQNAQTIFPFGNAILVGAIFATSNLRAYNLDGSPDNAFPSFKSTNGKGVTTIISDASDNLYLGGHFLGLSSADIPLQSPIIAWHLARLRPDQTPDNSFLPFLGRLLIPAGSAIEGVNALALLSNGDLLVGGDFLESYTRPQPLIARVAPDGRLRDFRLDIDGTNIQKIAVAPAPDPSALILGNLTNVNGVPTDGFFKLPLADDAAPLAKILFPTNGSIFRYGDGVGRFLVTLHATDSDGFPEEVRVTLDDLAIITNRVGDYSVDFGFYVPSEGEHQIKLTVRDNLGLTTTDTITFTAEHIPFNPALQISIHLEPRGIVISYPSGILQESTDLQTWRDVVGAKTPEYLSNPLDLRSFFRLRSQ